MINKKSRTTFLVVLLLLVTLIVAVTPVGAEVRRIVLLNAVVKPGGATFTFRVHGDFDKFSGYVVSGGQYFDLKCHLRARDNDILVCHGATRGLETLGDTDVWGAVNGFFFETYVGVQDTPPVCEFVVILGDTPGVRVVNPCCRPNGVFDRFQPGNGSSDLEEFSRPGNVCIT